MTIYILLFVYIILISIICKKNKKIYIALLTIPLIILTSMRSIDLGLNDTKGTYLKIFNEIGNVGFFKIIELRGIDELFFFLSYKIITLILNNYRFVLFILCLPYILIVSRHIYKYSKNFFISIIVFIAMYYLFSFYLIKQCIAMGLLILSYEYIVEKKPIKFIIMVLIAAMFHKMTLIFLISYPFANYFKFSYKNYIYLFVCFIIARYYQSFIYILIDKLDYTGTLINYIGFGIYSKGNESSMILGYLIDVVILIYCHMFCKTTDEKDITRYNVDLNLLTLGCIFFSFSSIIVEFYRVASFFSIFCICRISNLNEKLDIKIKQLLNLLVPLIFIMYFLFVSSHNYNANPYKFYWEDPYVEYSNILS